MRRTRLFPQSAAYSVPLGCHTALVGELSCAAAPAPSAKPATPLPASEDTDAVESTTLRIRWPSCSTM
jgi:hypothetical protein